LLGVLSGTADSAKLGTKLGIKVGLLEVKEDGDSLGSTIGIKVGSLELEVFIVGLVEGSITGVVVIL
jgi:hypothetical protein